MLIHPVEAYEQKEKAQIYARGKLPGIENQQQSCGENSQK